MSKWSEVRAELEVAKSLIEAGRPQLALERLNLLVGQQDPSASDYSWCCAAILRMTAIAADELGHEEFSDQCFRRAVQLLQCSDVTPVPDRAEIYIGLAELLAARGCEREALHFADAALECLLQGKKVAPSEELVELLRRYGLVAQELRLVDLAQQALTLGLLALHALLGLETDIALDVVDAYESGVFEARAKPLARVQGVIAGAMEAMR